MFLKHLLDLTHRNFAVTQITTFYGSRDKSCSNRIWHTVLALVAVAVDVGATAAAGGMPGAAAAAAASGGVLGASTSPLSRISGCSRSTYAGRSANAAFATAYRPALRFSQEFQPSREDCIIVTLKVAWSIRPKFQLHVSASSA